MAVRSFDAAEIGTERAADTADEEGHVRRLRLLRDGRTGEREQDGRSRDGDARMLGHEAPPGGFLVGESLPPGPTGHYYIADNIPVRGRGQSLPSVSRTLAWGQVQLLALS